MNAPIKLNPARWYRGGRARGIIMRCELERTNRRSVKSRDPLCCTNRLFTDQLFLNTKREPVPWMRKVDSIK